MSDQNQGQVFDADAPFVGEDGLEYANIVDYLRSRPVECARNGVIKALSHRNARGQAGTETWGGWIAAQYYYQNRNGDHYANTSRPRNIRRPQLWDRFAPGYPNHRQSTPDSARDGGASSRPAPPAAVREAGEPEVQRGLGA